jgi:leader peptidase (prepilin peptidase)/N-methyltransferase
MNGIVSLLGLDRPARAWAAGLLSVASLLSCWLLLPAGKAACGSVFLLGLIGGSCVDLDQMILPDLFTIGLAAAGVALSAAVPSLHGDGPFLALNCLRSAAAAALGVAIGSALLLWLGLVCELALGREVLGFGDVKFIGAIGAFCGWQGAVFSFFGGAVIGAAALALAEAHRRLAGEKTVRLLRVESPAGETGGLGWSTHFPFGPMLAAAAGLYYIVLHPWVDRYLAHYAALF